MAVAVNRQSPAKPDPESVRLLTAWLQDLPADEVKRYAASGSASTREAARLAMEKTGGREQ